jgi:hypothetical protein
MPHKGLDNPKEDHQFNPRRMVGGRTGVWDTRTADGGWEPATLGHDMALDSLFGDDTSASVEGATNGADDIGTASIPGGIGAEGLYDFLLQLSDRNSPIIRNAPNGDLILVDRDNPQNFTVIAKASESGLPPEIRLDGQGNLVSIDREKLRENPKDSTAVNILVRASKDRAPTTADVVDLAEVELDDGRVVNFIVVGDEIRSFVGPAPPRDVEKPRISGTHRFDDGVTRVFFADDTHRDVPAGQALAPDFGSVGGATAAGKIAGIPNPEIWINKAGRFQYDIPAAIAPSGTKIVSQNTVGNETIFELESGQVIRQPTPVETDWATAEGAATAAIESGMPVDQLELFVKNNRWNFTQKQEAPVAPSSFFTDIDPSTGRLLLIDRTTGASQPISQAPRADEVVTQGGRQFKRSSTGELTPLSQLKREFDPDVVAIGGRAFIQGLGGALTPLGREEVPNLDELINQRIISGDAPGALALSDFRDRPTSLEAFNAAMQFAQSPGDVAAISAISRGQTLVSPPPTGDVQRIAEQPEFLQDAYSRLINQFRGGTGSPEQFIDVLTRINKEADDRKTALVAQEREATALKEKNQQLTFSAQMDSALVPFREQIASLSSELAAFKTTAGGAAVGAAVGSGDTGGVPGTSGTPFPFDATVASPTTDAFNEGAKLAVASGLTGDAARQFALQFAGQGEEAVGDGIGEDPQSVDPASLEERLARVDAQREENKARRERENILVQQRKREQDARDNMAATRTTPPMEGFSRLPTSEDELIAESYLDEPTMPAAFKQEIRMEHRLGRDEAVGAPLTPLQMDQISQGVYPPPPSVPLLPPAKKSGEKTALTPFQMDQLSQGVDALRYGGITSGSNLEIVGEGGAELVDLPPGTRVTPLSKLGKDKVKKLKEMGIIGMQEGGIVGPLLPFGVRRALAGGIIEPTRRRLSRAAGLPVLSAQARQNLLPEELDVFNRLSREAGIPEGAFKQEQQSAFPGANLTRGRTRFAPRVLR